MIQPLRITLFLSFLMLLLLAPISYAETKTEANTEKKLIVEKALATDDVQIYALVGELDQRSPENLANNSTHGVIVTKKGVILVDSGGSYLGAQQIHNTIKTLTDQPVKIVINTGGQDHRWFGNDYFKQIGAKIISSSNAQKDHKARADSQMMRLKSLIKDKLEGTKPVYADVTFDDHLSLELDGLKLELHHFGPAHTPGDSMVWLPDHKVMFTGDIVYVDRALGIGPARNAKSWIAVFEKMAEFKPEHIIPGHGHLTDLDKATKDTYDYLVHLRDAVAKVLDDDGDMEEAIELDQSKFSYLKVFDQIAKKNAQNVFQQMEFE